MALAPMVADYLHSSSMRVKTWKVIDRGEVPNDGPMIAFPCRCGYEAMLPVRGRALAIIAGGGVVFDTNERGALPAVIQCRKCLRILGLESVR